MRGCSYTLLVIAGLALHIFAESNIGSPDGGDERQVIEVVSTITRPAASPPVPLYEFALELVWENGSVWRHHTGFTDTGNATFSGWLVVVTNCELQDVWGLTRQAVSQSVVAVIPPQVGRECLRSDVLRTARRKHLRGILELVDATQSNNALALGSFGGGIPWLAMRTSSEAMLSTAILNWIWIDVTIVDSIAEQDIQSSDGDANDNNELIIYVAIGTLCGTLTGVLLLLVARFCDRFMCRGFCGNRLIIPQHYEDGSLSSSAPDPEVVRQVLSMMPVGPYTKLSHGEASCEREHDDEPCSICLDNMRPSFNCRMLPCGHIFHTECIDPWLLSHQTCPLCIVDVVAFDGQPKVESRSTVSATSNARPTTGRRQLALAI